MKSRNNDSRARNAKIALDAYGPQGYGKFYASEMNADPSALISDLICDLLHLAASLGLDPDAQIDRALLHYNAEREAGCVDCGRTRPSLGCGTADGCEPVDA